VTGGRSVNGDDDDQDQDEANDDECDDLDNPPENMDTDKKNMIG
jgi:hypothetical protein